MAAMTAPLLGFEPPVERRPEPPAPPARKQAEGAEPGVARPGEEESAAAVPENARPYLGVVLDPVPELLAKHLQLEPGSGVIVGELVSGGPAEAAGLAVDDVVVRVAGQDVASAEEVREVIATRSVGEEVTLDVVQRGESRGLKVVLGAAPQALPSVPGAGPMMGFRDGGMGGLGGLDGMLQRLPQAHADRIREAMERNRMNFEQLQGGPNFGSGPHDLLRRIQEGFGEMGGIDMDFQAESTVRLMDGQGSVEMRTRDGQKIAKVMDGQGNVVWEGPYDTEQDKAAVPDDVRERLERLDSGLSFRQGGFHFRMGPQRFRNFGDMGDDGRR